MRDLGEHALKSAIDPGQAARRLKRQRRIAGGIAAAGLLSFAMCFWRDHRLTQTDRNHAMSGLTSKMKPLCIGRYLLDVPAQAEIALGSASFDSNRIERIPAYANDNAYAHFLEQHETALRSAKHDTEGTLLKSVTKSADGLQTVFVSRPEADDRRTYLVESFVNVRTAAWHVSHETGAGSSIKVLRRAKVQADGRTGQEYVDLYPEEGAMVFSARLELYGNATPQQPTIKLLMEAG